MTPRDRMPDRRQGPSIETVLTIVENVDRKVDDLKTQAKEDFAEVKGDVKEIKAAQAIDAQRITQLEMWKVRWEGMKLAMAWLPPVFTGIMVGVGVLIAGKVLGL